MNIELYYEEKGSGEHLILLHGNGENHGYFKHQMAYFSKKYHVWALDTRGHGKSPRGTAPFTIRQFADDLKSFMDLHEIEKAHILGFSDGGNIALIYALRYPEKVNRLILNGANLYSAGVKPMVQIPIILSYRWNDFLAKRKHKNSRNGNGKTNEIYKPKGKAAAKAEMLGLMVNDPDLQPEDLAGVKAKTLVIAGTKDMIKTSHTRLIAEKIPGAELALLNGDHFIAEKRPEAFNAAVDCFMRG